MGSRIRLGGRVDGLAITRGISPELVTQAARLIFDAFPLKVRDELRARDDEQAIAIIARSIDPARAWVACDASGALVGVIGVGEHRYPFLHVRFSVLRQDFGLVRSLGRWVRAASTHSLFGARSGQWHIDIIAVEAASRSRGVGSALMGVVRDAACEAGVRSLHLEVVDTNPRARALYARLGFHDTLFLRTGPLTASAGYRGAQLMRLDVGASGTGPT